MNPDRGAVSLVPLVMTDLLGQQLQDKPPFLTRLAEGNPDPKK